MKITKLKIPEILSIKIMSSKILHTFLTMLKRKPVQASTIVSFLESGDNSSVLSLESLVSNLKSLGDENIPDDIIENMESQTQLMIIQRKEEFEEKTNRAIVDKSFTNYSEVVTSAPLDSSDKSIVSEYPGKNTSNNTDYYVLHCPIDASNFSLGEIEIKLTPISPIPFTGKDGNQKSVSYKFTLYITCPKEPIGVEREFARIKIESIYHLIGMSFIKPNNINVIKSHTSITIEIDTHPFFENLASKYNSYFSNLKQSDGTRLSEISEIETCQIDYNGLILVPKLFYLSSIYTDGHLGRRPYIWAPDKGINQIELYTNRYKININPSRECNQKDIDDAIFSLCARLLEVGISVKVVQPKEGFTSKNILLSIEGYNNYSEDGGNYQSDISGKLNLEAKVSRAFRKLCRQGFLSTNDFLINSTRGSIGKEKYSFVYNPNTKTIESNYDRVSSKFFIYFNRSSITSPFDVDGNPNQLVKAVIDRNNAKFTYTNVMIDSLANSRFIQYGDSEYPEVPGDYIPTSFIPILFEKKEKINGIFVSNNYLGISFIPFGFARYVSIDSNIATSDSAFAIYGSDISMEPVSVRHILKLSNEPNKVTNVFQIIIESPELPKFEGDQPLLSTRLDDTHYLSLFRSTSKVTPLTKCKWLYASNYVEDMSVRSDEKSDITTLSLILNPENRVQISKRSMLRYATESLGSVSEFNNIVLNNVELIFQGRDTIDLEDFCRLFMSTDVKPAILSVDTIPERFFELLMLAVDEGVVNSNVIRTIMAMIDVTDMSFNDFICSIQKPVRRNNYPTFSSQMQIKITSAMNYEIENVTSTIYDLTSSLDGKTGSQIIIFASSHTGLLRTAIEFIGKQIGSSISTYTTITNAKNNAIEYLSSIATKPILPSLIGQQIDINFIRNASASLDSEIFIRLIKTINSELSSDSYDEFIVSFLTHGTTWTSEFIVNTISPYRYTITFDSKLLNSVLALNGEILHEIDMEVLISDERCIACEFGKQIYNHNIHAMFEFTSSEDLSINEIIVKTLQDGDIYYSQFDGTKLKADLSLVSLYGVPEIDGIVKTVKFFIPFNYGGARLVVDKTIWYNNNVEYKLLTKTIEIEFRSEIDQPDAIKAAIYDILLLSSNNLTPIRSAILGIPAVKKRYIREGVESHFFFTSDISSDLQSGVYDIETTEDSIISNAVWEQFKGNEVEIEIFPISPIICKYNFDESDLKDLMFTTGKKLKLPSKHTIDTYNLFQNNIEEEFTDQFISYGNVRSTMLITRNKKGIYTTALGNLDVEARIAKGNVPYDPNTIKVDMSDIDELTTLDDETVNSIEERILKCRIDLENSKRDEQNVEHNLGLILSTIRWNTKQIENYKFINNESFKWIRFSHDSYFMAIAFQSGVKIYIASGDQFVFCSNLPHEGVSDITFGNNNLCVTTQYSASDKPFSKLWIPASGIQIKQKLKFYNLVSGDFANIKYISGTTNEEKKNRKVTIIDGEIFHGSIKVQSAVPIFNHNVYFFSPDDKYMLWNDKGSFNVLSLNNMSNENKYVKFETLNGIKIEGRIINVKPIESGVWINKSTFMGISYSENNPLIKTRVILNVDNKTIVQTDMTPDFPTMTLSESMLIDSYVKVHPLFTHLISEKKKYTDIHTGKVGHDGIWLWNLYFSLTKKSDGVYLNFNTTDGIHSIYKIPNPEYIIDQLKTIDIPNYLTIISQIIIFESIEDENGIKVKKMTWNDDVIFDISKTERNDAIILQCIDNNYFAFHGDSIYIWSYRSSLSENNKMKIWTELSHVDSKGYERMTFENYHVSIIISEKPNAAIIFGDQLQMRPISLNKKVSFNKKPEDVTSIVKPVYENYDTDYFVNTEVTFEIYNNKDITGAVVLDSRVISSNMCLNRFPEYTTKAHVEANNTDIFTVHDNLLINCNGNVVKIIPKTVPTIPTLDGLTAEWYNNQKEDSKEFWESKYQNITNYFSATKTYIPQIANKKPNLDLNYRYIKEIMSTRNINNFELGINELRLNKLKMISVNDEFVDHVLQLFRDIFKIMKSTSYITNPDLLIDAVFDYWNNRSSDRIFTTLMKSISDVNRRSEYNKFITLFAKLAGDNFISYNVGDAFNKLNELQYRTVIGGKKIKRTVSDVKKMVNDQIKSLNKDRDNTDTLESLKIMDHVLSIPYISFSVVNVSDYSSFLDRLPVLRNELKRVEDMKKEISRYDLYHALEHSELKKRCHEFLIKKLTLTTKLLVFNKRTDYINCLTAKYNVIPRPDFIDFNGKNIVYHEDLVLINSNDGNVEVISAETYKVIYMKDIIGYLNDTVYHFFKEKAFNVIKNEVKLSEVINILNPPNSDGVELDYVKQFKMYINEHFKYQKEDVDLAINDLVRTLSTIKTIYSKFESIDSLFEMIEEIFVKRFPRSLYNLHDELPDRIDQAIKTNDMKLPIDTDPFILETNVPYIEEFFNFYYNSLKKGYYLNDGSYNQKIDNVKKHLLPIIWKYRQGVSDDKIPVVGIKITFKRPVVFEQMSSYSQRETEDLIFKYEMDEDKVKHGEKYGSIKVNLLDIISNFEDRTTHPSNSPKDFYKWENSIMRIDGSTKFNDHIKQMNTELSIEGIKYDCGILQYAIDRNIIDESKAIQLINKDLPPINLDYEIASKVNINSVSQYSELLEGTYKMIRLRFNDLSHEISEAQQRYIMNMYRSRVQFTTMNAKIFYKFEHVVPGLEFTFIDVPMIYESKPSQIIDESIDISRRNITIGSVRPYYYETRLLEIDGKPFIYKDNIGESYIIWYGNTIVNNTNKVNVNNNSKNAEKTNTLDRAYIVTQKLSDRSMKTYHYVKYKTGNNAKIVEEAHAMKLFFDHKHKENREEKKEELKTYINYIKVNQNGEITYSEQVKDRKFVQRTGYIDVEIEQENNSHIANFINSWEPVENMDEKKFSDILILSHETKIHGDTTITISNYKAGRHIGSIVEVFQTINDKFIKVANWNFYMYSIKTFDFNDKELFLVGSVYAVNGIQVKIGVMDLTKRIPEPKAIFINFFDREINLIDGNIPEIINATCNTKDTTFITYNDGNTSYLIIANNKASYEKKFNDLQVGIITSVRPSVKNGYVALYFEKIDRTEIWSCDGTLFQIVNGECNWM